ncbi:MAG: PEP-CTERM sorting domain-containing protein [Planctomycetes bacterium]|nr:PEP-CTERM sorting domain-containing protein [Planctomycetota bacterium]
MKRVSTVLAWVLVSGVLSTGAEGSVVFVDNFDGENGGTPTTNFNGYSNWTTTVGSTDLIGSGFFDVYPGNGLYVDLDGTTSEAGTLESTANIPLTTGQYLFEFDLGDTNFLPGSPGTPNGMTVTLFDSGGGVLASANFDSSDTAANMMLTQSIPFDSVSDTGLTIQFLHDPAPGGPGDTFGLIIDNVQVTLIPEPGTIALFCLAIPGMLGRRARRNSNSN